jgi:hypothetical protein
MSGLADWSTDAKTLSRFVIRTCPDCGHQWTASVGQHAARERAKTGPFRCARCKTRSALAASMLGVTATKQFGKWRARAACAGANPEWFSPSTPQEAEATIEAFCDDCPVRAQCAQEAMVNRDRGVILGGVWIVSKGSEVTSAAKSGLKRAAAGLPRERRGERKPAAVTVKVKPASGKAADTCLAGHPRTPENTRIEPRGRRCRVCDREYRQRRREQGRGKSA